jgi:DNA-binding response OmpR family regulator
VIPCADGDRSGVARPYAAGVTARVLVVDDDATVRDVVARYLGDAGYRVDVAADGDDALRAAALAPPEAVVLDLMLPSIHGLDVCRALRAVAAPPAIVVLTALGEEDDRIRGLELGADDYVTKPFSPRELVLRVGAVLRRATAPGRPVVLVDGALRVDTGARRATLAGTGLGLTTREFDLLAFLVAHPGRAFTRAELLAQVWGWDFGDQSTVTVHVRRLREKIETDPTCPRRIATIWGTGYRYDAAPGPDG